MEILCKYGFADPLMVYTPSLSLPLEARGRGLSLMGPRARYAVAALLTLSVDFGVGRGVFAVCFRSVFRWRVL